MFWKGRPGTEGTRCQSWRGALGEGGAGVDGGRPAWRGAPGLAAEPPTAFLPVSGPCRFSWRSRSPRRAWPRGRCSRAEPRGPRSPRPASLARLSLLLDVSFMTVGGMWPPPSGICDLMPKRARPCPPPSPSEMEFDFRVGTGDTGSRCPNSGASGRQKELACVSTGSRRSPW